MSNSDHEDDTTTRGKIAVVCGNIGSGKSTLLDEIARRTRGVVSVKEALRDWNTTCKNGKPLLENYYQQPKRYALQMQQNILVSQLKSWKRARNKLATTTSKQHHHEHHQPSSKTRLHLLERSFHDVLRVFTPALVEHKYIPTEWLTQQQKCEQTMPQDLPDLVLWIDTDVEVCMQRIKKRGRPGEQHITLEYLKTIRKYELEMLQDFEAKQVKIYSVQGNQSVSQNTQYALKTLFTEFPSRVRST